MELVAPEHLSPRRSIAPGSRDEGTATCTLHARRAVFSSSLSVLSSINIYPSYLDSPGHLLPLSSTRQVVVELGECRNRYCEDIGKALSVYTITIRFYRLVVMPEACVKENGTQQYWADAACTAVLLFIGSYRRLCLQRCVETQVQTPVSDADVVRKWGSMSGCRPSRKGYPEKMARKNAVFGSIRINDWFVVRKRTFSREPSVRDGRSTNFLKSGFGVT